MGVKEIFDVVIIGGGLTGYSAGILLVKKGLRVAVIEGFPWEWWLKEESRGDIFRNYSGAILYGVPGSQTTTSLLIDLGVPINNPGGEGRVSLVNMEPGLQVLLPGRWANLYSGQAEILREISRIFPGRSEKMEALFQKARKFMENDGGRRARPDRRHEEKTALAAFLDGWSSCWNAFFARRRVSAKEAIGDLAHDEMLSSYLGLFVFGLARKPMEDASDRELHDCLTLSAKPSAMMNETGQKGIIHCLRSSFQKIGGVIYREHSTPCVENSKKNGLKVAIGSRRHLSAGWLVFDAPEDEIPELMDCCLPSRRKDAPRPAVHLALTLRGDDIPPGMGGHLVMNLDSGMHPLILTLAPGPYGRYCLEALQALPVGKTVDDDLTGMLLGRVRRLLRFLPEDVPGLSVRKGWFPASCRDKGLMERLRLPGGVTASRNMYREGRSILVGRGDYLGSSLNGALNDGRDLAAWLSNRCRKR